MQTNTSPSFYLPLDTRQASLALVGGKGQALAKLAALALPVPPGFHLTTVAYHRFVEANQLQAKIMPLARDIVPDQPVSWQRASEAIKPLFMEGLMPDDLAAAIHEAYASLGGGAPTVAVRSSATAEDLPNLSFAGQQESYLNVSGALALLTAVRRCWASLWTARAMGYRARMGVGQQAVAMGVVVQQMVPAEVSGVLFTANPTTGERTEMVVNASFGLGEAIVSGQVTPDSYILDRETLTIKETILGAKETMIVSTAAQGVESQPVPQAQRDQPALLAAQLRQLGELALQAEATFAHTPQDIEWAVVDGKCWLLQSRPITNLPPAPLRDVRWEPPAPGVALVRRQVVENMPDPLSPLFEELYLQKGLEESIEVLLEVFGWDVPLDDLVERPFFLTVNGYAYSRGNYNFKWKTFWPMLRSYVKTMRQFFPRAIPYWRDEALPAYLAVVKRWKALEAAKLSDEELQRGVRELATADAIYWFAAAIAIGMAKVTDNLLHRFLTSATPNLTSGTFLRGFPSKTLETQIELEAIAQRVRSNEALREFALSIPAQQLFTALADHPEGQLLLEDLQEYFDKYGHQVYTLDFAEPTQVDDPLPTLLSLRALVQNPRQEIADRQAQMVRERQEQTEKTARSFGPLRRWWFYKLLGWAQRYGPYREEALFYSGAAWPTLRRLALELGRRLTEGGFLHRPDDIFYLESLEITAASRACSQGDFSAASACAQKAHEQRELREARKQLHPPAAVPPDYRLKFGPFDFSGFETQKRKQDSGNTLKGFAVSPGRITAVASVIHSPADFDQMVPGSILVCPTTTPAWTPLFSQATGLVTDIGGILAHGSIVAREYGIPAVMGTGNATQRIAHGQQITVDGHTGQVILSESDNE